MARTRANDYDKKRLGILSRSARLIAQHGFTGTSITMIADACGVSKALMYHYYRDKEHLLADIADSYIDRLQAIVDAVAGEHLPPAAHLRRLIEVFMLEYEHSAARHRVLVQDVKYLERAHRARILAKQRTVVQGFADVIAQLEAARAGLAKPLTMILFGMINWTFTWLKESGPLTYADMAPVIADLFLGGVARVRPAAGRRARTARAAGALKAIA
jgi:AcrR family transcriptional regulator